MCTNLNEKVKTPPVKLEIVYRGSNFHTKVGSRTSKYSKDLFEMHAADVKRLVSELHEYFSGKQTVQPKRIIERADAMLDLLDRMGNIEFYRDDFNQIAKIV